MKEISHLFLLFLICAIVTLPLVAYTDDFLELPKKTYKFEEWAGKDGSLKQGVLMKEVSLTPYEVLSERSRLRTSGETILRYGLKASGKIVFEVSVFVGDTVLEAQEALLKFLAICTMTIPTGKDAGVAVGDVCFAAKDGDAVVMIAFVRNNIFIRISMIKVDETSPDIVEIAKKIDERIKSEEEVKETKDLKKPRIDFSAEKEVTGADTPVELNLKIEDSQGGTLYTEIDEGGGMVYDENGKKYFKAEKPGEYKVTIYARSERFLVSKKSITIKVE
ncbi:MAG: hypothetical protein N2234_09775 [Planctomycetota bacterium]|nr:hypothetical protein [Planctomycetota bacterium]